MLLINMLFFNCIFQSDYIFLKVTATANGEIYYVCWRKKYGKCKNTVYANAFYGL